MSATTQTTIEKQLAKQLGRYQDQMQRLTKAIGHYNSELAKAEKELARYRASRKSLEAAIESLKNDEETGSGGS